MTDDMPHIPKRNSAFVDARTPPGEQRAAFVTHTITEDGVRRIVYAANALYLGQMMDAASMEYRSTIRVDMADGPNSLMFLPNAEEMRALAAGLIAAADREEQNAKNAAAAALARAMNRGKP